MGVCQIIISLVKCVCQSTTTAQMVEVNGIKPMTSCGQDKGARVLLANVQTPTVSPTFLKNEGF